MIVAMLMNCFRNVRAASRGFWGVAGGVLIFASAALAADWPHYRGPTHNGVSTERINKNWSGSVTTPVWLVHLTNGLTSLTVSGGRVFTQVASDTDGDTFPDKEYCLALNATNGTTLWATEVESGVTYTGGVGTTDDGPRTTPAVVGDSVYVLTSHLRLCRLHAGTGSVVWVTNLLDGFGGYVIDWQNAASPVIENGLIFVNANSPTGSLMAFSTTNGTLVWRSQNEGMTHSTPVLVTMNGVRQLIFATQSRLVALNPQTGALLWKSAHPFGYSTSIGSSPAVHQNYVFITANYSMSSYAVQVILSNTVQVAVPRWTNSAHKSHWSTAVCAQGALFGTFYPDNATAQLRCIDLATGTTKWSTNGFGRGGILLVGTNLLIITESNNLVLSTTSTNTYIQLGRFQAIPNFNTDNNKCWNALALSDGQLYVRSTAYAARFDLSVPDLKLEVSPPAATAKVNLTIRTVPGTPVASNRLAGMEIRATTNAALSPLLWSKLTNSLVWSNGVVRATNVDAPPPRRFFIVTEPQ